LNVRFVRVWFAAAPAEPDTKPAIVLFGQAVWHNDEIPLSPAWLDGKAQDRAAWPDDTGIGESRDAPFLVQTDFEFPGLIASDAGALISTPVMNQTAAQQYQASPLQERGQRGEN